MKLLIAIFVVIWSLLSPLFGAEHYTSDPEWKRKMLERIEELQTEGGEAAMLRLGGIVHKLELPTHRERPQRPVFEAAQSALISIPGHAELYDQRIREHLQRAKKFEGSDRQFGFATTLMDKAAPDFRILSLLPSPETVRVLGELLSEDWVVLRNGQPFNRPLAGFAMSSLHRMPFTSKPVQGDYVSDEKDLETYRLWYAQIKAGNRTFRFEGDPNEYTLAGPVRNSPDVASMPPKARDSANASPCTETGPNSSTPWLAITLGGTLIGGALWYWLASRRRTQIR